MSKENQPQFLHDVYLSYSRHDALFARALSRALKDNGVTVFTPMDDLKFPGINYESAITSAIVSARFFIALITPNSIQSKWLNQELGLACGNAQDRSKIIIPVLIEEDHNPLRLPLSIEYLLRGLQYLRTSASNSRSPQELAQQILSIIRKSTTANQLYAKLSEYAGAGLDRKASEIICQLLPAVCDEIGKAAPSQRDSHFLRLLSLLEKLHDLYDYDYSPASREFAHEKLHAIAPAASLLTKNVLPQDDLYSVCIALRLLYLDREIRWDCADAMTGGDASDGIVHPFPVETYIEKQQPYADQYRALLARGGFPEAQRAFIESTREYIYNQNAREPAPRPQPVRAPDSPDDELLHAIASYIHEGNKLFDVIGKREGASDFLQCLLTSYERLKAFCEVTGAQEVCAECIDRLVALRQDLTRPRESAATSEKAANGIKSLLGLTLPGSGMYDVFISHKQEDFDIADGMYTFLKSGMKEAFLDRYSLPEMAEAEYHRSIMQALDRAKHFVVILSSLDYLNSHWVALEMQIFQSEMDEGRKPGGNFLMVVTNEVYDRIISSNKAVLPIQYRRCEIMRVEDYKNRLLHYMA